MNMLAKSIPSVTKVLAIMANDGDFLEKVNAVGERLATALVAGHTVLIAGNGGSAAEAQHFSAEIVGHYERERRGYSAIALTTDTSILTAIGNDYDFRSIFARQVEALGKSGDIFIGLSTSGNSENIIRALEQARMQGIFTVSFLGKGGGKMKGMADFDLIVPSDETPRIQEAHLVMIHSICEMIDIKLS
jgi:D-sedoheptulose 7-phosphate isomerase